MCLNKWKIFVTLAFGQVGEQNYGKNCYIFMITYVSLLPPIVCLPDFAYTFVWECTYDVHV